MLQHHSGEDPIDQLKFIADQGFTAFEDNEMRIRTVELQKKMAKTMTKYGIEMGVISRT
jgi:hydroxypyruvate isomerase